MSATEKLLGISDKAIDGHTAALAAFDSGLTKVVAAMRNRMIELLADGTLTPERAAKAQALITLQTELQKQLNSAGYPGLVKELISSYDASVTNAIAAVKAMGLPDQRLAPLDRNAITQLKNVDYSYLQGLGSETIKAVAHTVISSTVGGPASRGKLIDSISATLDTRLKGYAVTYADTALVTYDRTVSMDIWQQAGIKGYMLRGPKDIKNRPLCHKYVNKVLTLDEIKALDEEAAQASKNPLLPVLRYGFGWNCRHVWAPWPNDVPAADTPSPGDQQEAAEKKPPKRETKAKKSDTKAKPGETIVVKVDTTDYGYQVANYSFEGGYKGVFNSRATVTVAEDGRRQLSGFYMSAIEGKEAQRNKGAAELLARMLEDGPMMFDPKYLDPLAAKASKELIDSKRAWQGTDSVGGQPTLVRGRHPGEVLRERFKLSPEQTAADLASRKTADPDNPEWAVRLQYKEARDAAVEASRKLIFDPAIAPKKFEFIVGTTGQEAGRRTREFWREGLDRFAHLVGEVDMGNNTLPPDFQKSQMAGGRAYQQGNGIHMNVDGRNRKEEVETVVHELGHWLEGRLYGWQQATEEFLQRRAGKDPVEKMSKLHPGQGYADHEVTQKDKFLRMGKARDYDDQVRYDRRSSYVGKVYRRNGGRGERYATEVISMALEDLQHDPAGFAQVDPEYFDFIMGLLRPNGIR